MTARRVLVPDSEVMRVLNLWRAEGLQIGGLAVGRDYVQVYPPSQGGDSVAQYIGPDGRQEGAR